MYIFTRDTDHLMPGCGSHSGVCCVPRSLVWGCPALATCIYLLAFLFVSLAWLASGSCPGPPLGPAHSFLSPPAPGACLTLVWTAHVMRGHLRSVLDQANSRAATLTLPMRILALQTHPFLSLGARASPSSTRVLTKVSGWALVHTGREGAGWDPGIVAGEVPPPSLRLTQTETREL